MTKKTIARFAAATVGIAMMVGAAAPIGAVTIAELQAQINALMAQLAALQGGTAANPTACTFTRSLTVGSSGADVTCLQNYLTGTGHFNFSGGSTGYFGPITRSAVAAWQSANSVAPAVGYFGPISQARYSVVATVAAPGTTTGGTTTGTGTVSGGITTPGVEGTITVTKNPNPASGTKLYEGDSRRSVLGIKIEAKTSDMRIERVKIDMDHVTGTTVADQNFYNKIANRIYVLDPDGGVLASMDLNSSTVVKDGSDYFVTLSGFNYVVPKDAIRVLTIAVDGRSTWDSDYDTETWSLGIPADGVRSIDGAGINQYGPSTAFSNNFTTEGDLAESATLTISTASDTPQDSEVMCTRSSTEDECDRLTLLKFNVKAEKDAVLLTDLNVSIVENLGTNGDGGASTTAAYLYDGGTLVGSATVLNQTGGNSVIFADIDYTIPKDTTRTLTFQVDVVDTTVDLTTLTASTTASQATAENSAGTAITESGTGTGETIGVRKAGPEFTLVSASIVDPGEPGFSGATTTAKATFVIKMKAVGADIEFGESASTTYALAAVFPTGSTATGTTIYRNGAAVSGETNAGGMIFVASSSAFTVSPTLTAAVGANSLVLSEGNEATITYTFSFDSRFGFSTGGTGDITSGLYAVQIDRLNWLTNHAGGGRESSAFMSGNTAWRTVNVSMP